MDSDKRFDRLEEKIDKLTDVVTSLARMEERLIAHNDRVDRLTVRVDDHDDNIKELYDITRSNQGAVKFADKFFWLLVGGVISFAVWAARVGVSG
jgi:hypothetical protein